MSKKRLLTDKEIQNLYFDTYKEEWWRDLNKFSEFYNSLLLSNDFEVGQSFDKINFINEIVSKTSNIKRDIQLLNTIKEDISNIYEEVGGQDGMYENFPFYKIFRGKPYNRIYALNSSGGLALISENNRYQIITLGEDDGYFYPTCQNIFESIYGKRGMFVELLGMLISAFNNNEI